jgi:hypothetical protein
VTVGPSWHRARGSILDPGWLAGTSTTAAAAAQIGGQEMRRGLVWPRRPVDAAVQWAQGRGT